MGARVRVHALCPNEDREKNEYLSFVGLRVISPISVAEFIGMPHKMCVHCVCE